jgi:hypothetical protein
MFYGVCHNHSVIVTSDNQCLKRLKYVTAHAKSYMHE